LVAFGGNNANANGLLANTYTVLVSDANSCSTSTSQIVGDNPGPSVIVASTTSVSCFGGNNATATASVSGGTGPFTYTWSPSGGNTVTATGLTTGIYTVSITSANGCLASAVSPTINEPTQVLAIVSTSNVSCFAGANGTASVTAFGGNAGYTYTWMPSNTNGANVGGLTAGNYSVEIADVNNCSIINTYSISQPVAALSAVASASNVSCFSGSDGSVFVSASGGTAPYSYTWTAGNINTTLMSSIPAGTYSASVNDIKGCVTSTTVQVTQPTQVTLSSTSINSDCGAANGQASVNANGGTGAYSYTWSPSGGNNANANGLLANTYTVLVSDANGCSTSTTQIVGDNPGPSVIVASTTSVSCFGGNNATATASVSGGTGPFTYTWSPSGGNTVTATGLTTGIYTVSITSANGCLASAVSPTINEPTQVLAIVSTSNVSCFAGANGTASVTAFGGNAGYTYTWMPSNTNGANVGGLTAGNYSVQIADVNNCSIINTYSISQPVAALSAVASASNVSCFSGSDGSVFVSASGGTAPYSYTWTAGNINTTLMSSIPAGTYSASVNDIKGCVTSTTVQVTQPTQVTLSSTSINSDCGAANGQASVNASGGTGAYSYTWSPSGGNNANANGLLANTYTVLVSDANGCSTSTTQIVGDNPGPSVIVASTTSVSCFGGNNATATASVSGGTGPFTYTWSPSGGNTVTATGLTTGIYTVSITSANGCLASAVSPTINEPTQVLAIVSTSNVSCFAGANGTASVTAFGGNAGYTYTWMPSNTNGANVGGLTAGNYSVQIADVNNCSIINTYSISQPVAALTAITSATAVSCFGGNNGIANVIASGGTPPYSYTWTPMSISSQTVGGLSNGIYTVNVADSKNCSTSATVQVTQPLAPLTATATSAATSCSGGSDGTATITPTGGTANYTYSWSPSGGTNSTASGLTQGNYFVTVFDANSCQTNVALIISSPSALTGSLTVIDAACNLNNGSISSQISGGTGPYNYTWTPGNINSSNIASIPTGNYSLLVNDFMGCPLTLTASVGNIPGQIVTANTPTNVTCFGGSNGIGSISVTQGTPPYSINWAPFGGNTLTATGLSMGVYTITVTDNRGCINSTNISIAQPSQLSVTAGTVSNVTCFGLSDGSITVIPSGGTPGYSYTWSPTENTNTLTNLAAGNYTVRVADSFSCSTIFAVDVSEPQTLLVNISDATNPTCFNGSNGTASALTTGGITPYTYTWTSAPQQFGSSANNLPAGIYSVTVTDLNNCAVTNTVSIVNPPEVFTIAGANDTICLGLSGGVTATANGGAGGHYYAWQPGGVINNGTLPINPAIATMVYTVVAYDQLGCAGNPDTVRAVVYSLTAANINAIGLTPICPGQGTTIYAEILGSTGPLNFTWNNNLGTGPGAFVVIPNQPTTYVVSVTNACGQAISDSVQVLFNPQPTVVAFPNGTLSCIPTPISFTDNSVSGNAGDPITTWTWNFGDGNTSSVPNPTHLYSTPGTYTVTLTVSTNGGCNNSNSTNPITIIAAPYPIAAFTTNNTVFNLPYESLICTNTSTGAVTYYWEFGDGNTSTAINPQHLYGSVGFFDILLVATNQYGCSDTATTRIKTDADIVFPNAFTPNSDGPSGGYYIPGSLDNDIFFPYASGVVEYKFQIFNRWGELIFETEDFKQGWDGYYRGKLCQLGVYVWKAYAKLNNGVEFNKTGDVTLLR
jgi:large repetitive protein